MTDSDRQMTVTRVFDAPRDLVFRAFVEPEHFAAWFGAPPYTTPAATVSMDVTPGGAWSATMVHETDGTELPFAGRYREISPPDRLVFTFEDLESPGEQEGDVVTVTFTDLDGKTEVSLHQIGNQAPEQYVAMQSGYGSFFDRLEAHLAELQS